MKDLWYHVRLLEGRCRHRLVADQHRLAKLDGCLGELHNVALLQQILAGEALASRKETANGLRVLRMYQWELRRRAATLGAAVLDEKPRHFVHRIKRTWELAAKAVRRKGARSCRRAA